MNAFAISLIASLAVGTAVGQANLTCEQYILSAGLSSLMVLAFDPCSNPPSLYLKARNSTAIQAQASPWITRHTTNPSE